MEQKQIKEQIELAREEYLRGFPQARYAYGYTDFNAGASAAIKLIVDEMEAWTSDNFSFRPSAATLCNYMQAFSQPLLTPDSSEHKNG